MIKKKKGRPRKYSQGIDKGTPEQQLKKLQLVLGGNTNNSTTPLDVALERSIINAEQHWAGVSYQKLHKKIFGTPYPESNTGKILDPIQGRSLISNDSKADLKNWRLFKEVDNTLKEHGKIPYGIFKDQIIYHLFPDYMYRDEIKVSDNNLKIAIQDCLTSLCKFFYKRKKTK